MDFSPSAEQTQIRTLVETICRRFDDSYWQHQDEAASFPEAFYRAIAEAGLLGIAMPEAEGGSGFGIAEASTMMRAIAESGAGMAGASSVHMNIFGLQPVVAFGTDAQRARMLPPVLRGESKLCFCVTEPDAGLDTTRLTTRAERDGERYLITGAKIWISTAQVARKALILARTTPLAEVERKTEGLSLFCTDLDRAHVEIRPIRKHGRHAVDSNMMFFDAMPVPAADRIGAEGEGFRLILHGLNAERILIAAEAVGLGFAALRRAVSYARTRIVFDRPIGQNQGIQHPLARCWMDLEAAALMAAKAAALYDAGAPCGAEANAAKYLAAEAAYSACETAVMTHGGMGYAAEYHVERYLRESLIPRIAPVSPHMILNHIAEKVLGLPRSY